jgi:hypothetical protein
MQNESRSFDRFEDDDLAQLAGLAERDLLAFTKRNPHHASLTERVLIIALCQGAALHYVNGTNGVKDFDVWTFFSDDGRSPAYPVRRRGQAKFDSERFKDSTCRVDLLGRTLKVPSYAEPIDSVRSYLGRAQTDTAWHLAQKAVVVLKPDEKRGEIAWPSLRAAN